MFRRLKEKWKLNWTGFVLVFTTFALGGSLCGYAGKKLMAFTSLDKGPLYYIIYIILVTIIWPICVLTVSIPMGQFPFFKNYLAKMWKRISGRRGSEKGEVKGETEVHGPWSRRKSHIRHQTSDI